MDTINDASKFLKSELESNDLFRQTFLNSPMGVLFFDSNALLVDANDYMFRLFGLKNGGVSGKKFCDVFMCSKIYGSETCNTCPFIKAVNEVIETGKAVEFEQASHEFSKNGRNDTVWFNLRAIPYSISENEFVIMLLADITKQKYLESNLKNLGITDGDTLLYYRKFITEQLEILATDASLVDSPLSIMLIDIDDLEDVNDEYGNEVGDEVITGLANIITKSIRHSDYAGRYGGDEYLLLLPDTKKEGAGVLADRILRILKGTQFDSLKNPVTFSAGILEINHPDININNFISAAISLMQQKRTDGKNGWLAGNAEDFE